MQSPSFLYPSHSFILYAHCRRHDRCVDVCMIVALPADLSTIKNVLLRHNLAPICWLQFDATTHVPYVYCMRIYVAHSARTICVYIIINISYTIHGISYQYLYVCKKLSVLYRALCSFFIFYLASLGNTKYSIHIRGCVAFIVYFKCELRILISAAFSRGVRFLSFCMCILTHKPVVD